MPRCTPRWSDPRAAAVLCIGLGLGVALSTALATASPATADSAADGGSHQARASAARVTARAAQAHTVPSAAGPAVTISRSGQSPFTMSSGKTGAAELSGITYAGDTTYYAVGDSGPKSIWQLYTSLNTSTGRIRSSLVTGAIAAPELGSDSEGIALRPGRGSVFISDEITSSISEFSLSSGAKVGSVDVPAIYRPANVQNNMGLESLTYRDGELWTANEEALRPDGALSTTTAGSWVRLQQFTGENLSPAGQFGYLTDPISELSPFVEVERSGLVDLLVLPGGELLALERELGGFLPRFRSRIYLVGLSGATDVNALPSLADGGFTPVSKILLWQGMSGFNNFEGLTLGPALSDGSYGLVLVSDDGNGQLGQRQTTMTLILAGVAGLSD